MTRRPSWRPFWIYPHFLFYQLGGHWIIYAKQHENPFPSFGEILNIFSVLENALY